MGQKINTTEALSGTVADLLIIVLSKFLHSKQRFIVWEWEETLSEIKRCLTPE